MSISSFNPCYVGLWSVSPEMQGFFNDHHMFQSLLCWIMVCKFWIGKIKTFGIMFQSLLCWIMVCKLFDKHRLLIDPKWFQSLLCWIMVCKGYQLKLSKQDIMFQSLLCWIMVCKPFERKVFTGYLMVSILVMLDYGL